MPTQLPPKKEVMLALLESTSVFIHLDPRRAQVVVPPWFTKQPQLVLQVGLNMAVPIRDLSVDDECVSCTLSFNRSPFFCWIPWTAVYALVGENGRGMVWPDDVPPEVTAQAQKAATSPGGTTSRGAPEPGSPAARRQRLRAVEGGAEAGREAGGAPAPEATPAVAGPSAAADDPAAAPVSPPPEPSAEAPATSPPPEGDGDESPRDPAAARDGERKARPAWLRVVK